MEKNAISNSCVLGVHYFECRSSKQEWPKISSIFLSVRFHFLCLNGHVSDPETS